jgi:hypothetical protein
MISLKTTHLSQWLGAIALTAFIAGCADESGTVVDVDNDRITVADDDTQAQTTYRVSPEADITRDGDSASLLEVQPGDEADITLDDDGDNVVTDLDASSEGTADTDTDDDLIDDDADDDLIDDNLEGPNITPPVVDAEPVALEGSVAAMHEESMMVQVETEEAEDNEIEIIVDDNTEITLDGVAAEFGDILPGYTVLVSADDVDGRLHGDRIEATSTETTPPPVTEPEAEGLDPDSDTGEEPLDPDGVPDEEPEPLPEAPAPQP